MTSPSQSYRLVLPSSAATASSVGARKHAFLVAPASRQHYPRLDPLEDTGMNAVYQRSLSCCVGVCRRGVVWFKRRHRRSTSSEVR
ncbi:hypothetical protein GN244_ATG02095 [Phytophthora infestans]|uniref:Uncharacterized protein n=1 Tax=Phytophthora infestans TaxID=4787 RepID=A0A833SCE6_PHYIN|nr:hypothetical protein GN244_ATG02095 [Phytophthora infestans]